eukprot:3111888-Rhodomonas_salina.3
MDVIANLVPLVAVERRAFLQQESDDAKADVQRLRCPVGGGSAGGNTASDAGATPNTALYFSSSSLVVD